MSSHKILTGFWKKKKWNQKYLFHFLHEITPAQLSFAMEVVSQNLGRPPSKYWGHKKINIKLPQSKEALEYFLEACKHPKHIMSRKFSEHKEAAGAWSAVGEAVVSGAQALGRGAATAGRYLMAHAGQIASGVGTALQLGATGVQLAAGVGLLDPDSDATLIALANATNQIAGNYQQNKQAAADKKKASAEETEKKGEGWKEIKKWASDTGDRMKTWAEEERKHPTPKSNHPEWDLAREKHRKPMTGPEYLAAYKGKRAGQFKRVQRRARIKSIR